MLAYSFQLSSTTARLAPDYSLFTQENIHMLLMSLSNCDNLVVKNCISYVMQLPMYLLVLPTISTPSLYWHPSLSCHHLFNNPLPHALHHQLTEITREICFQSGGTHKLHIRIQNNGTVSGNTHFILLPVFKTFVHFFCILIEEWTVAKYWNTGQGSIQSLLMQ